MSAPTRHREFLFPDAEAKLSEEHACLTVIQREICISLPPKYIGKENEFINLVLNAKLGKYDDNLQCIPVSIRSTKRLGKTGIISGENPNIYFKVLTDFIVFRPMVASQLAGTVEKLSPSHIGLLVHGWFNASVPRDKDAKTQGNVGVGDEVLLEVVRSVINRRILSLDCKLLNILKKVEIEIKNSSSGTGKHKSFDSDEESANVESGSKNKKRKRSNTACSDSGIDPECNLDASMEKPAKKKKKKEHRLNNDTEHITSPDDHSVENVDESISHESPHRQPAHSDNSLAHTTMSAESTNTDVIESRTDSNVVDASVCEEMQTPTKKHKNKNKHRDRENDISEISSSQSKKKKKKSRKSHETELVTTERDSVEESCILEHVIAVEDSVTDSPSSVKKKHKKKKSQHM